MLNPRGPRPSIVVKRSVAAIPGMIALPTDHGVSGMTNASPKPRSGNARWFDRIQSAPIHPFLFGLYPVLALLAANIGQVRASEGARMLAAAPVVSAAVLIAAFLATRRIAPAAFLATITVLLFLSYGHLYDGLKLAGVSGTVLVRHRYLVPAVLGVLFVAVLAVRRMTVPTGTTVVFNAVGLVAIALPLVRLGIAQVEEGQARQGLSLPEDCSLSPDPGQRLPDVYLIIMDAYERDDVLWEMHGYDNSPFLDALEDRGFFIGKGSLSNFRQTELSLASVLNFEYIQSMEGLYSSESIDRWGIIQSIRANRVRHELECLGYLSVATETGAFWTEWDDADYFLDRRSGIFHDLGLVGGISRFEEKFLRTTIGRAALDGARNLAGSDSPPTGSSGGEMRNRIRFELDQLEAIPGLPSPKLVFVHVLSPHPPFVFGPNGEEVDRGEFETGRTAEEEGEWILKAYADQVTYLNGRLLRAVDAILSGSETPPIIVIMGDHGWADRNAEDKMSILNAYYLPGDDPPKLWPTITPVNTFRVLFDSYFGGAFGKLDDRSYFSHDDDAFNFQEVTNTWRP